MSMTLIRKVRSILKGLIQSRENIVLPSESIQKFSIGASDLKNPVNCYQIGSGEIKVLFVSGIHGNEVGTVKLVYRLIDFASKRYSEFPRITFYAIPCLNPDGFAKAEKNKDFSNGGKIGRCNDRGVDLNRNFDTPSFQKESLWSFGKDYRQNIKVYCGEKGNSELEIQAVTSFIESNNIKFVFSFHNVGSDILPGVTHLSRKLGEIYSEKTGFKIMPDAEWRQLKQTGTFKEWCDMREISFIEVETSKRWGSDWIRQLPAIKASIAYLISQI